MKSVFDRMAAARAQALVLRDNPVAWKVNKAALTTLRQEGAIDDSEGARPIEDMSLFGLPIVVDPDDRSEEPLFWLMAAKPKKMTLAKMD